MNIKQKYILLLFVIFAEFTVAQSFEQLDSIPRFRGFEWGSSIQQIKKIELADYKQTYIGFGSYIISYSTRILGYDTRIDYVFEDSVLAEAAYEFEPSNFDITFRDIKNYYYTLLGIPNYWSSSHPDLSIYWNEEDNGICRGPEIYWEYCNGFIGIVTEKYKEEITITILYVFKKTIRDYGKYVKYPYEEINVINN